jgi:hypothetical protein
MNRPTPCSVTARLAMAVIAALALGACTSQPRTTRAAASAYGSPACFDPAFARGFQTIDDDVLLIDAGSRHYRVELDGTCHRLDWSAALAFRGDPVTGRVCGRFGDAVLVRGEECRIHRVDAITPESYRELLGEGEPPAQQ